jgi:hypothetical protein
MTLPEPAKYALSLLAVATLAATSIALARGEAAADEDVPVSYDFLNVDIRVLENTDMLVTETQSYTFGSAPSTYGYRWLPVSAVNSIDGVAVYEGTRRYAQDPAVRDWVSDPEATPTDNVHAFTSWTDGDKLWIAWWYPETASASRTFQIRYSVHGGLDTRGEQGQIAWRAVFRNRTAAIGSSRVAVHLPNSVAPAQIGVESMGVTAHSRIVNGRTIEYTTGEVAGNEGLDVRVTFPLQAVLGPEQKVGRIAGWTAEKADDFGRWIERTAAGRARWEERHPVLSAVTDWLVAVIAVAGLVRGANWILSIRRERTGGPALLPPDEAVTEPPDDLPPAIVGRLLGGSYSFLGDVFYLAQRGCLHITEELQARRFGVRRDFVVTLGPTTPLHRYQRLLLRLLFHGRREFLLSEEREFRALMARRTRREMEAEAIQLGLLEELEAKAVRTIGRGARMLQSVGVAGLVVGVLGLALSLSLRLGWGVPVLTIAIAAFGGVALHTARAPGTIRRSMAGAAAAARWRAFGKYLKEVSAGRRPPNDATCFDRFLPYAAAFRVDAGWAKAFAEHETPTAVPAWYQPRLTHLGGGIRVPLAADNLTLAEIGDDFRQMLSRIRISMGGIDGGWGSATADLLRQ